MQDIFESEAYNRTVSHVILVIITITEYLSQRSEIFSPHHACHQYKATMFWMTRTYPGSPPILGIKDIDPGS